MIGLLQENGTLAGASSPRKAPANVLFRTMQHQIRLQLHNAQYLVLEQRGQHVG